MAIAEKLKKSKINLSTSTGTFVCKLLFLNRSVESIGKLN